MAEEHPSKSILIENAQLLFRNFRGEERGLYNAAGSRNVSVKLEPDLAKRMIAEGWRVKQLKPRDGETEGDYHLKVNVNYGKGRPPRCVVITSNNKVDWGQDEIGALDSADIEKCDILINGWWSDMSGGGYGGFLKTIMVWLREDALELRIAELLSEENQTPGGSYDDEE